MAIEIHGKFYRTVAERLEQAHKDHKDLEVQSEIVSNANGVVVVKGIVKYDGKTFIGHASEKIDSSMINKTSALENAETSAWGRALSAAGYAGSEIASAEEVANAIKQQNTANTFKGTVGKSGTTTGSKYISEPQRKRLFAICKKSGIPEETMKEYLREVHGIESSALIPKGEIYDEICMFAEEWQEEIT